MDEDDWNDLNEYTSDTDADSSGCGPAMYDSSDGPREHDEEELMSPPNLPNGGGGGGNDLDACPNAGYYDYWACVDNQHGNPPAGYDSAAEYCSHICYDGNPMPPGGLTEDTCYDACNLGGCFVLCGVFGLVLGGKTTPAGGLIGSIGCGVACSYWGCHEICDHVLNEG